MRVWLKRGRLKRGLSQAEVSARAKISQGYYNELENGRKTPTIRVARAIAEVLGLDWARFYEEDNEEKNKS